MMFLEESEDAKCLSSWSESELAIMRRTVVYLYFGSLSYGLCEVSSGIVVFAGSDYQPPFECLLRGVTRVTVCLGLNEYTHTGRDEL